MNDSSESRGEWVESLRQLEKEFFDHLEIHREQAKKQKKNPNENLVWLEASFKRHKALADGCFGWTAPDSCERNQH